MNKVAIDKCINDSSAILKGTIDCVINTDSPAGFIMAGKIERLFKERMEVWGRFENNEINK